MKNNDTSLVQVKKVGKVARAIAIMSHPIPDTNDSHSVQIILPQKQLGRKSDMWVEDAIFWFPWVRKSKEIRNLHLHLRFMIWEVQVCILLLLFPQRRSKREIYCICLNRSRNWSPRDWTKARYWSSWACRWDFLRDLRQIRTSKRAFSGQLFHINSKLLWMLFWSFLHSWADLKLQMSELWCHNSLRVHCLRCAEYVYIDHRKGENQFQYTKQYILSVL